MERYGKRSIGIENRQYHLRLAEGLARDIVALAWINRLTIAAQMDRALEEYVERNRSVLAGFPEAYEATAQAS